MKRYLQERIITFSDLEHYAKFGEMPQGIEELGEPIKKAEIELHPDEEEKETGLYKKPSRQWRDLIITIETPKGTTRSGTDKDGKEWSQKMFNDYGYIEGTKGKDKDHIDCFIGEALDAPRVFIVNQVNPKTGNFDEHKCMIGFPTLKDAQLGYLNNYEADWQGMGSIVGCSYETFKDFIFNGDVSKPFTGE